MGRAGTEWLKAPPGYEAGEVVGSNEARAATAAPGDWPR
jgi:hypothetical protein